MSCDLENPLTQEEGRSVVDAHGRVLWLAASAGRRITMPMPNSRWSLFEYPNGYWDGRPGSR